MDILIVGPGAVGQVFGRFLQKSGAKVSYFVKPEVRELFLSLAPCGLVVTAIPAPVFPPRELKNFGVLSEMHEVAATAWDQIWFCVPSNVYYGEWFRNLADGTGNATLVLFPPEGGRSEFLPERYRPRVVLGGVPFLASQRGYSNGKPGDGVEYWIPPFAQAPFSGPSQRLSLVIGVLRKAGFRAKPRATDISPSIAAISSILTPAMAGLECAGWSLEAFRKGKWLQITAQAASEALRVTTRAMSVPNRTLFRLLAHPYALTIAARLAPHLTPFDLEKYLKFHYLKTGPQTSSMLKQFIADGELAHAPVEHLKSLSSARQALSLSNK